MQAISAKGAHLQSAAPAYMGSKYNTQEASTELLTDLESERAAKYGGKNQHAGGLKETAQDAALPPTKQIS